MTFEFIEKLSAVSPADLNYVKTYSGASEAMESALKFVRQYWKQSGSPGKYKVSGVAFSRFCATIREIRDFNREMYGTLIEKVPPCIVHQPVSELPRCHDGSHVRVWNWHAQDPIRASDAGIPQGLPTYLPPGPLGGARSWVGRVQSTRCADVRGHGEECHFLVFVGLFLLNLPYAHREIDCLLSRFHGTNRESVTLQIINEDASTVAGIIVEPIGNTGGLITPTHEYFEMVRRICDKHSVMLIFDETITGFCKTGSMFGAQTFGVTPDLIVTGKGISNGVVPLAAMLAREDMADAFVRDDQSFFAHGAVPPIHFSKPFPSVYAGRAAHLVPYTMIRAHLRQQPARMCGWKRRLGHPGRGTLGH
eukprot:SAG31_NODE_3004_length_4795_cov_2.802598_5_plen_364_part_00